MKSILSENSTTTTATIPPLFDGTTLWTICQIILLFCTVIDFYLFICFLLFYRRTFCRKFYREELYSSTNSSIKFNASNRSNIQRETTDLSRNRSYSPEQFTVSKKKRRLRRWMLKAAAGSSCVAFLKCLVDQSKFYLIWDMPSDKGCNVIDAITEVVLYGSTIVLIYAFLWIRQWMFYNSRAVKDFLYSKCLIRFSRWIPIPIAFLAGMMAIINIIPQRYKADTQTHHAGCLSLYDIRNSKYSGPIVLYICLASAIQLCLMGLFVYPFVKRKFQENKAKQDFRESVRRFKKQIKTQKTSQSTAIDSNSISIAEYSSNVTSDDITATVFKNIPRTSLSNNSVHSLKVQDPSNSLENVDDYKEETQPSTSFGNAKNGVKYKKKQKRLAPKRKSNDFSSIGRVVIWCSMCIVTDVTSVALFLSLKSGIPLILVTTLNNINLLTNQLCIAFTYNQWKEVIFPMFS